MKSYEIEIIETLHMTVSVDANDEECAKEAIESRWKSGEYVLDASHFRNVEFYISKNN